MDVPRQFVFGGSSEGEPWWALGEITAKLLAPLGYADRCHRERGDLQ
jgi:hypothetical protein